VTLPIGIAESITTQNDYVVATWLLLHVALTLASASDPENIWYAWGAGISFGLGVLTKATIGRKGGDEK